MPKFYRQNKKRIDPRYFLSETIEKQDNEINEQQLPFGISTDDALNMVGQGIDTASAVVRKVTDPQTKAIIDIFMIRLRLGSYDTDFLKLSRMHKYKGVICRNQGKLQKAIDKLPRGLTMRGIKFYMDDMSRKEEVAINKMLDFYESLNSEEKKQVFGNIKKLCSALGSLNI